VKGVIFTVLPSGCTNFPGNITIEEKADGRSYAQVSIIDDREGGGRLIEDEYVLCDSLMELTA
jgi:hypothetical protein